MSRFNRVAKDWDKSDRRQATAYAIAKAIVDKINLNKDMEILDFGAGTGLLTKHICPFVKKITAIDNSEGMLKELEKNSKNWQDCNIKIEHNDILEFNSNTKFDAIISSMTMHHIKDIDKLFKKFSSLLKPKGFIAIADLMPEDGTFHSHGNEDVYHFGFSKEFLEDIAQKNGFKNISYEKVHTIEKPKRSYDIFLLTASKD